jgi:hypothetical protein
MRNPPKPCRRGRAAPVRNLRTKRQPRVEPRTNRTRRASRVWLRTKSAARGAVRVSLPIAV